MEEYEKIESQLYSQMQHFRCLQKGDSIRLKSFTLQVTDILPNASFVCMNETDVEVVINLGEYQPPFEEIVYQPVVKEEPLKSNLVEAVCIGTGEKILIEPI